MPFADDEAAQRWGIAVGDRVVSEQIVPCWECRFCKRGQYHMCQPHDLYGFKRRTPGAMASYMVYPAEALVHKVSGDVAPAHAAFAEPLAVGMHAVEQANVREGDGVAVFGCGPVGLAAIASLVDQGHEQVLAVDLSATRRDLALGLGAQAALDPATDDVWAALADLHGTTPFMFGPTPATAAFIEASGSAKVLTDIIDRGRVGGRLSVVALHYAPVPTSFLMMLMKEFTVRGSMEYPERFADAVDLLARRDLSALVTDRFPLEQFDDALALLEGSKECGKVMVAVDGTLV